MGADSQNALGQEIFRLADEGHDPLAIAQQLDQPIGMVQLTLNLRRA